MSKQTETKIEQFRGKYAFLSNFYFSEIVLVDGTVWPTAEHLYQALKTRDQRWQKIIREAFTPGQAKKLGRKAPLREDWEKVKLFVMESALLLKFDQHEDLKRRLIDTGDAELIESNTWGDDFWGVVNGRGRNHLGGILMMLRETYKQ